MRQLTLTRIAALLLAFLEAPLSLSGCAHHAAKQEIGNAAQTVFQCLIREAKTLDDHKSEAITVAYGVLGACDREIRQAETAAAQDVTFEEVRQTLKRRLNEYFLRETTAIVLKERSLRAEGGK